MVGVDNVTGEVELLASVVDFFKSVGLTSKEIKIKVNSRKVLNAAMINAGVPNESFAPATVIVDKLDKIGRYFLTVIFFLKMSSRVLWHLLIFPSHSL